MTAQKQTSKTGPVKKDGKKGSLAGNSRSKKTAKYTLWRFREDVKNLGKVRAYLEKDSWEKYKTDSGIYKALPELYLDAVKTIQELKLQVSKLTAKEEELAKVKDYICRLIKIGGGK